MKTLRNLILVGMVAAMASCSITTPMSVSDASIGNKRGVSKTISIGLINLNGNYGVKEAARNGNISGGIATVDEKTTTYFLGIRRKEMIITGE